MKFTKGYWMNLPGVTNTDAVQVREVKVENDRVYLYTVPYHADIRAMGGPLLEMYISSPQPDIIRTEAYHFMGSNQKMPAFELNDAHCALEVENTETTVTIKSGNTKLVIGKNPCSFDYYYKDKKLTSVGNRFGNAMISTISTPDGNYMRAQMNLDIGEKVYGLGERFTPYVKNGQTVETWNEDVGRFQQRYFTYVASFGAFTRASYETPQNVKNALGHLAYILEGMKSLASIRPEHVKLIADGRTYERELLFGAVSNSTSLGGVLTLDPDVVDMNDGKFEIMLVHMPNSAIELNEILTAIASKQYECSMIDFIRTERAEIFASPDMDWSLDGEHQKGSEHIVIENIHDALRILTKETLGGEK